MWIVSREMASVIFIVYIQCYFYFSEAFPKDK